MDNPRDFLKDSIRLTIDFSRTAQSRGLPPPPIEKPAPPKATRIDLPGKESWQAFKSLALMEAIANRSSRRAPTRGELSLPELSFLLWATQGIRKKEGPFNARRVVPSAGCRHSFETYIAAFRVEGMKKAIYRYLPLSHQLIEIAAYDNLERHVAQMALGQTFAGRSAATFIWTTIPSRMEWRYGLAAHKVIAIDAGHVCQNLYLACEAVGCGTCAIAAYDQDYSDEMLGVDGEEEFTIYMAPVSKI